MARLSDGAFQLADVYLKNLTLAVVDEGDEVDAHDDKLSALASGNNSEELATLTDAYMQRLAASNRECSAVHYHMNCCS